MKLQRFPFIAMTVMAVSTLVACDWVDSAGGQGSPANDSSSVSGFLDDVAAGEVIAVSEQAVWRNSASRLPAGPASTVFYSWSAEPVEQGNLASCAVVDGFNADLAADSLEQACTDTSDCNIGFETLTTEAENDPIEFRMTAPQLQASVGLTYALSVQNDIDVIEENQYTFCLVAINEAPDAKEDVFSVRDEGEELIITAGDINNLLANDSDDIDVSNTTFEILTDDFEAPQHAASFSLGSDGGFTYRSEFTRLARDREDTFTYRLTDGVHISEARVTITVAAGNQPPRLIASIPELQATVGVPFFVDFAEYFTDPDGDPLTFLLDPNTPLASRSGLSLNASGQFAGEPVNSDIGSLQLTLNVSDGSLETSVDVILAVMADPASEADDDPGAQVPVDGPEEGPVDEDPVGEPDDTPVTPDPVDDNEEAPETEEPVDEMDEDPADETGQDPVGTPGQSPDDTPGQNPVDPPGQNPVDEADDDTDPADDGVDEPVEGEDTTPDDDPPVAVPNRSPVYISGLPTVGILRWSAGERITAIRPIFEDPDGDTLEYRIVGGQLPEGTQINSNTGVITGTPTEAIFVRGLRVRATDSRGRAGFSTPFSISVVRR